MCGPNPAGCELRLVSRTWCVHHDAACAGLKLHLRLSADPYDTSFNPGAVHPLRLPSLLQRFRQLRSLDLAGSSLDADSLQALGDGLPHLSTLYLTDCRGISDDGLRDLSKTCTTLTSLTLRGCAELTYDGGLHLDGLTGLTSLDLFGTLSTPHGWWLQPAPPRFLSVQALTHLDLTQTPIPEETLRGLIVLTNLTSLELAECPGVTDATMAVLGRLPMLAKLNLAFTDITEEGLRELEGHGTLTELDLSDTDTITDAGMQALKRVPALSTLRLKGYSNVGNLELEWMAMLPALTELDLTNNHDLSDDGLASLARMSRLKELHLLGYSHVSLQMKCELERNLPHLAIHFGPAPVLL